MTLVEPDARLGLVVALLVALAVGVAALAQLGLSRAVGTAAARAVVQLAVVSLVIAAVLDSLLASLAFVAFMLTVASVTGGRRLTSNASAAWAVLAVCAGALPVLGLVLGCDVVPFEGPGIVAISGIVIGATMTATAHAGMRALDELRVRTGEYQAALALGLTHREAGLEICRGCAAQALIPPLDQTRTVGLVTLPGAFIGVLLSGGSAAEAGAAQILVLAALLAAQTIAVAVVLELVVRGRITRQASAG